MDRKLFFFQILYVKLFLYVKMRIIIRYDGSIIIYQPQTVYIF